MAGSATGRAPFGHGPEAPSPRVAPARDSLHTPVTPERPHSSLARPGLPALRNQQKIRREGTRRRSEAIVVPYPMKFRTFEKYHSATEVVYWYSTFS